MVDIHGPLQTRGDTRCPEGVSVSCLASRTRHECVLNTRHFKLIGVTVSGKVWPDRNTDKTRRYEGKSKISESCFTSEDYY